MSGAASTTRPGIGLEVRLGGCPVDLVERNDALDRIAAQLSGSGAGPLGVVSVNLDHVHHFGAAADAPGDIDDGVEWLNLIDGAPLAAQAERLTGRPWPRLAGSDLVGPILDLAESRAASVGFLGGSAETHARLRAKFAAQRPGLRIAGLWAPTREELDDPQVSRALAVEIAEARTDVLVVCLGKPRQERWISRHGVTSGAAVLLAFGAVVDFLAGRIDRAPRLFADHGLEWAWRLAREPRRLARRYLVQGPPAYRALRRRSAVGAAPLPPTGATASAKAARFATADEPAHVAVLVVTYNSGGDIDELIDSLRREGGDLALRVIVADNDSSDDTVQRASAHGDVTVVRTGGNLGYSGGLNAAMAHIGESESVLVLNPDLAVQPGAIAALRRRMAASSAAVVVPRLLDDDGVGYRSLRREPTVARAFGDALLGSRLAGRPARWTEMVNAEEEYERPHPVEWATGAALLIDRAVAERVGAWDERYFLYSEETDFFRRVRAAGGSVWFEPSAVMRHRRGGSGSSDELIALMAVNRIRYMDKHASPLRARLFQCAVVLHEALRYPIPSHRLTLGYVARRSTWPRLPRATMSGTGLAGLPLPLASVIIPAHNERAVIARTLLPFASLVEEGVLEVIVVCNGCTDDTAAVAADFAGVRVLELDAASKVAALNAGDASASAWPRIYLDADIELSRDGVFRLIRALASRELSDDPHSSPILAGRPAFRYETARASAPVRAYYRARSRIPSANSALWGAGVYALTRHGHERFERFPDITADDLYVDALFSPAEKSIVDAQPAVVRTPLRSLPLLRILRRGQRGSRELGVDSGRSTVRELLATVHGLPSAYDAAVYAAFALAARVMRAPAGGATVWERDLSTRVDSMRGAS
jgi:exopolysaccharide biosynthesis WecB/TagA/CpsF family protein